MKLLFHVCCAPCSIMCIEALRGEGIEPVLFWYNPNIHPLTEYAARRDCLAGHARLTGLGLVMRDEYGLRGFVDGLYGEAAGCGGEEDEKTAAPRRCAFCYRTRLETTARAAKEGGFDAFSTSLLVSPYQNHELLRETGDAAAARYGTAFLYRDFRPLFREGRSRARAASYYMQKYCGCIFSEEERFSNTLPRTMPVTKVYGDGIKGFYIRKQQDKTNTVCKNSGGSVTNIY